MKGTSKLALITLSLITLGTSLPAANADQRSPCVELSVGAQEFVSLLTNELPAGTAGYLVAHLVRFEDPISGRLTSGAPSRGSFLLKTPSGNLRVQIVDLPTGREGAAPF